MGELRRRRDQSGMDQFIQEHRKYMETLTQKEIYWRQRSKQLLLKCGDSYSEYFHAMASKRRHTNSIAILKDDERVWRDWHQGLSEVILKYFFDRFTHDETSRSPVLEGIQTLVSNNQNGELFKLVSEKEVRIAIFQMHRDKSPGPDAMNSGFY